MTVGADEPAFDLELADLVRALLKVCATLVVDWLVAFSPFLGLVLVAALARGFAFAVDLDFELSPGAADFAADVSFLSIPLALELADFVALALFALTFSSPGFSCRSFAPLLAGVPLDDRAALEDLVSLPALPVLPVFATFWPKKCMLYYRVI